MPVPCMIMVASLLCLDAPPVSDVTVQLFEHPFYQKAGIKGEGFSGTLDIYRDNNMMPFKHEGASRVCVEGSCLDYRRSCKKNGDATECSFELDHGLPVHLYLRADNDSALEFVMTNIAVAYHVQGGGSPFPLSLFDGSVQAQSEKK